MILIFSASAPISDRIAKSHGLQRSEYRHIYDYGQIQGLRGHELWVTPTSGSHRDYDMIMELARATELKIKKMDIKK